MCLCVCLCVCMSLYLFLYIYIFIYIYIYFAIEHSLPLYRFSHCSTTGPTGRRVPSCAPLQHGHMVGSTWLPWWPLWPLWFVFVLLSGGQWLAAAQVTQAPCAPGSAPSGPGGACVACVAGLFCHDGRTLPLPCPPGSFLLSYVCVSVIFD